jgi:anti-sigma regulatory factor (Ser/Thr protein kinase)
MKMKQLSSLRDEACLEAWQTHSGLRSARIVDGKLKLVLNNTLAAVEDGRRETVRFLGSLDGMVQNRLEVLFEELVTNTIRHGFASNSDQSIHVQVERGPNALKLTFEDDGLPFNPIEADVPMSPASADPARIGGMGIPLIVKLSSSLCYESPSPRRDGEGFSPRNRTTVSVTT